jgi:hypothetical protein
MKTIIKTTGIAAIFFFVILFQACYGFSGQRISGNGNVTTQERKVDPFNAIEASGTFNIILSQGETEALSVEADENLLPFIETRVEDQTLYIDVKKEVNIGHAKKKNIYVTLKNISQLKKSSVGNIETANTLKLQRLDLINSGVGDLNLDLECNNLDADIHSVGNSTLKGKAEYVHVKNSSVGNIDASSLKAGIMKINNSSVGNVEVYAEKEIYISSSGVGNLTFSGNAVVKEMSSSGVGKVTKK